jgi:hypothetical protein
MMSKRVFAMSGFKGGNSDHNERLARLQVAQDAMTEMVLNHPRAKAAGLTRDEMENAQRFIQGLAKDKAPTLRNGPSGEARVDSGDTISLTDHYTNAHGERVIEGYRRNGPHIERVCVVEERIDGRTTMVTRRMGGR